MKQITNMKEIITLSTFLFFNSLIFSQQIGDGYAPTLDNLNTPLKSGVYSGLDLVAGATPDSYGWQHLLAIRQGNPANNCQLQIISSFVENDRLFFRKFGVGNLPANTAWVEIATRGTNRFVGAQSISGKLDVNGTIRSKEVKVELDNWADFVFKKDYYLPTLEQVENHITEKGHLENIPSEEEVLKNGINLGEMNAKLLQKIEELTLYVIEQNKQIMCLTKRLENIESK